MPGLIRPVGSRFGLDPEGGWVMSVPPTEHLDDPMDNETDEVLARRDRGQIGTLLPDLNVTHDDHGSVDDRALLPYFPQEVRGGLNESMDCQADGIEIEASKPLLLFETELTPKVGIDVAVPPDKEVFSGSLELTLSGDRYGTRVSACGSGGGRVSSHPMGSDPFNLPPFIFGPINVNGRKNSVFIVLIIIGDYRTNNIIIDHLLF